MTGKRIFFSIILFLSIFFTPFWISAPLAIAGMFIFPRYWEGVFLLFFSDLLFGVQKEKFFSLPYVGLFIGVVSILVVEFLKTKLRFYQYDH